MIKGVIFDMDGTILNTIEDINNCLNIALKKYNLPLSNIKQTKLALGKGSRKLIEDSIDNPSKELVDEILEYYLEIYHENFNIYSKPYDGIKEVFKELENRNIYIGINSNKPDDLTKMLVDAHFSDCHFISVVGSRDNIPNKPDPYSCLEIINKMNINKDEVLYIGDSESDIKTAKNADIKSIGVLWGFRDLLTLEKQNCDYIVSKANEILDIIDKLDYSI